MTDRNTLLSELRCIKNDLRLADEVLGGGGSYGKKEYRGSKGLLERPVADVDARLLDKVESSPMTELMADPELLAVRGREALYLLAWVMAKRGRIHLLGWFLRQAGILEAWGQTVELGRIVAMVACEEGKENSNLLAYDAKTGKELWKERIGKGDITATPLAAGGRAYFPFDNGQTVVVENKGGASGAIGTSEVARAEPDGNTWGVVFDTHGVNPALQPRIEIKPPSAGCSRWRSAALRCTGRHCAGVYMAW
jgi:hypothetical protein